MKSWLTMLVAAGMLGCTTTPKADVSDSPSPEPALSYKDKVLGWFGVKSPEVPETPDKPEVQLPDRRIRWRLSASDALNLNTQGQPVALLTRLYKLKSADAFLKAPYETFGDAAKEKEAIGDDLVESRDLQLIPGQHYEAVEKVSRDINFIGIVALYRAPAPTHWRYAFQANKAEWSGLNIGLHACAMTVQTGSPLGDSTRDVKSAAVPCPKNNSMAALPAPETQP